MSTPDLNKRTVYRFVGDAGAALFSKRRMRILSGALFLCSALHASELDDLRAEMAALREKNALLESQLAEQTRQLTALSTKLDSLLSSDSEQEEQIARLEETTDRIEDAQPAHTRMALDDMFIGLSGSVVFFDYQSEGEYANGEFLVDSTILSFEARVHEDTYVFLEANVFERESNNQNFRAGEIYIDFENVSRIWNGDQQLGLRLGRIDVPFGEEYLTRDPIDNPLVSHSLTDFWGIDEGVELYGKVFGINYVAAVLNGGSSFIRDYNEDKALVLRLGYDVTQAFHIGASAMRTGALSVKGDGSSEIWFGNGLFFPLGAAATTTEFQANLYQLDFAYSFDRGRVWADVGTIDYDDNDSTKQNHRDVYFGTLGGTFDFTDALYGAARVSYLQVDGGLQIRSNRAFSHLFKGILTEEMYKSTFGLGYRISDNVISKVEYSIIGGSNTNGTKRDNENSLATQVTFEY